MGVIAGIGAGLAGLGAMAGTAGGIWTNERNQEFAEEMAGSQYQRAVADMKAAGLNPNAVFGSGGGSPAAAPGGQATNPVGDMSGLVNAAKGFVDIQQGLAQKELTESNKKLSDVAAEKAKAETANTEAATDVAKAAALTGKASARMAENEALISDRETSAKKIVLDTPGGKILHGINEFAVKPISAILGLGGLPAAASGKGFWGGSASAKEAVQSKEEKAREVQLAKANKTHQYVQSQRGEKDYEQHQVWAARKKHLGGN